LLFVVVETAGETERTFEFEVEEEEEEKCCGQVEQWAS
jgi:hypothetical protein